MDHRVIGIDIPTTESEGGSGGRRAKGALRRQVECRVHFETFNGSCCKTVLDRASRSRAEVMFAQETKFQGEAQQEEAATKAWAAGWKLVGGRGNPTAKGAWSDGAAVLVRRHIEVGWAAGNASHPQGFTLVPGRVTVCWVNTWVKGGFLAVSVYLQDTVEINDENRRTLNALGEFLAPKGMPFVVGGDFNMQAQTFQETGWTDRIRAVPAQPRTGTCRGSSGEFSTIDYYVVDRALARALVDVEVDPDEPARPHRPVIASFNARPRQLTEQIIVTPKRFPVGKPPIGCAPKQPLWDFDAHTSSNVEGSARSEAHYAYILKNVEEELIGIFDLGEEGDQYRGRTIFQCDGAQMRASEQQQRI